MKANRLFKTRKSSQPHTFHIDSNITTRQPNKTTQTKQRDNQTKQIKRYNDPFIFFGATSRFA
jgi:hypothetical protein